VSLVNPHDVTWWWNNTLELTPPALERITFDFPATPPNYESLTTLEANKPRLQTAYQQTMELVLGPAEAQDLGATSAWQKLLKLYLWCQTQVDAQIGRVLDTLATNPEVHDNTIVVFTSDHGEYGGSHGLRAKGAAVYEEGTHVPLYVFDPRGRYSAGHQTVRTQLTSSVDIVPLLLSLATGGSAWRGQARYSHLAGRADIAAIAADPKHAGRPWVAHATDEYAIEELSEKYSSEFGNGAPHHITSVFTPAGKYARYSTWKSGSSQIEAGDADFELYDYSSPNGRLETDNVAGQGSALERTLSDLLTYKVIPEEIQAPLPKSLAGAQEEGYASYLAIAKNDN
jgi:arylsulfatase A-like enzyme